MQTLADAAVSPTPVATSKLVRTWFILLPLLYFANSGFPGAADTASAAEISRTHQIALLAVMLICATLIVKRFAVVSTSVLNMMLIVALPTLAILSSLWSVDPRQTVISAVTLLCFTLFAIYLGESFTPDGQLDLIMLTGAVAVPASIALALLVPSIGATPAGWRGIFAHKQQCAAAVTLFLATAFHWKPNNSLQKTLLPLYMGLCIFLIYMSQSRTGWLLTIFAVIVSAALWVLQKLPPKESLFVVLTSIPVVGGGIYLLSLLATIILNGVGKDPTLSERTIIWAAVWDAIGQRPLLGYGYEAFWRGLQGASKNVVLIAGWNLSQAQSGYLDLWLQLGIFGVLALILMILGAWRDATLSFHRSINPAFVRWCLVVIFCNLLFNVGESDFGYLRILWLLFVMACIGLRKQAAETRPVLRSQLNRQIYKAA